MYRYLASAIAGIAFSLFAYFQVQASSNETTLLSAFLLLLFTYFSIVSIIGFFVSRSIKKMRTRMDN